MDNPFSHIQWVFFDLGDTLVDNTKVWTEMLADLRVAVAAMGRELDLEELTALFTLACSECAPNPFTDVQIRLGLDEDERRVAEDNTHWRHDLEDLVPGVHDLLAALRSRYKVGVIANQSPGSETRCEQLGLRPYFDLFLASAESGISKPDPRFFHLALKKAQCPPEKAVMVGDRIDNDIRPAKQLGMKTIRVLQGHQRFQQPRDEWDIADQTVNSIAEVVDVLLKGCML